VKVSFSGSNTTKYSGCITVAKYLNRQNIIKNFGNSFPTVWHNATKFGVNQILIAITVDCYSFILYYSLKGHKLKDLDFRISSKEKSIIINN